jgi:hypothetical protein
MGLRVKGQETVLTFISADGVETSFDNLKSSEITFERDILSEGYLGQTTEQKDDIFKGVTGKCEFHLAEPEIFDLVNRINEKTKRRLPGEVFEMVATYIFPDGRRRRIAINDPKFGSIPINNGSREDFVSISFDFAADDGTIINVG